MFVRFLLTAIIHFNHTIDQQYFYYILIKIIVSLGILSLIILQVN